MKQSMAEIPDKRYFRIGEVSELAKIEPYVLRYWETEFPSIKPVRAPTGQRLYRKSDVETVLHIKHLLYEKKFTIAGARKVLQSKEATAQALAVPVSLEDIKAELLGIKELLDKD
ncbi:MAG: MerR family transcriptional regulator [Pseudomonadota bacterium]